MKRLALLVPVVVALALGLAGAARAQDADLVAEGEELFETGCVTCHAAGGVGTRRGPDITDAGAASADFYLTTGRMPHTGAPEDQPERKPAVYDDEEIDALVAYVDSLGDGPPIPEVDIANGDLQDGGIIYRASCAACHSAAGSGGALSYGENAPSIEPATDVQVAEAVRIGPGQMPIFGPDSLDQEELDSLVRYVDYLQHPDDPGGFALGRIGPIPEGAVAILVGLGASLGGAYWIGRRRFEDTP